MKTDKPFAVDADESTMENHICAAGDDSNFPFEYSATNVWDKNFFAPENSADLSFDTLYSELGEIKLLITDIKNILSDIFETKTKDLDQ